MGKLDGDVFDFDRICEKCGKKITSESNIREHLMRHIWGNYEKTFPCFKCGQKFSHKWDLSKHLTEHKRDVIRFRRRKLSKAY